MAKKVALINMKGGVGKSTLTVNLAWHFAAYTHWLKRVLVVDVDPQFNASQYMLGVLQYQAIVESGRPTVWDIFEQNTRAPTGQIQPLGPHDPIHHVWTIGGRGKLDLIPSSLELAFSVKNPGQRKEELLSELLAGVDADYDLILLDCAPTESILTTAVYLSSDYLLVPVKPEYLSSIGLPLLVRSMEDYRRDYGRHELRLAGVVFNAASDYLPEEELSKAKVREIAMHNGWPVFDAEVPYSRSFPKGAREGQPIFRTSHSRRNKRAQFYAFAEEFARRIGL